MSLKMMFLILTWLNLMNELQASRCHYLELKVAARQKEGQLNLANVRTWKDIDTFGQHSTQRICSFLLRSIYTQYGL